MTLLDWAIVGYGLGRSRNQRFVSFSGGRSRRKLQWVALRMNRSGKYQVVVRRKRRAA